MHVKARHYATGEPLQIQVAAGKITERQTIPDEPDLPWVAPGFVDLQVNGYGGQEFNDFALTTEKIEKVCLAMDEGGVTGFCPTATTHSFEMLQHTMSALAKARRESPQVTKRVAGIHLEGPYISSQEGPRGAHPIEHCRPPDWDEFSRLQDAAEGGIRILTLSPEYDEAPAFIRRAADSGVVVAIGHTAANRDQIQAAVDSGARMSTHLGNGAHGQIPRHPNYIWDQLADDRLVASLIADGHHLPAEVVKCFVRCKTPERCVLVSDLVGMGGMPPGSYSNTSIGDIEILAGGKIVVAGQRQYLAGAGLAIHYGIPNLLRFANLSLEQAVDMATTHPARVLGLEPVRIDVGAPAKLTLFDLPSEDAQPLTIRQVFND